MTTTYIHECRPRHVKSVMLVLCFLSFVVVLPAHLNRDSFRDSFKGLVALEIIIDLPIGFPINNIISFSLCYCMRHIDGLIFSIKTVNCIQKPFAKHLISGGGADTLERTVGLYDRPMIGKRQS